MAFLVEDKGIAEIKSARLVSQRCKLHLATSPHLRAVSSPDVNSDDFNPTVQRNRLQTAQMRWPQGERAAPSFQSSSFILYYSQSSNLGRSFVYSVSVYSVSPLPPVNISRAKIEPYSPLYFQGLALSRLSINAY